MEDRNFGEAVKACKAKIKGVKSKPVLQKNRTSHGPSICIEKDSLANVKSDMCGYITCQDFILPEALGEGDILSWQVDAIACTTSQDFDLSRGAVSAALLRQGGKGLQKELYKKCSGAQHFGEVIPVSGHKLGCEVVFFGVMYPCNPPYANGYRTVKEYYQSNIHDFVQKCLNLAEKRRLRSVAFPAIGAGVLNYPLDIVFDEMFRTVNNWRGTLVKDVKFVIYPKDTVALQEFERPLKKYGSSTVQSNEIHHSGSIRTSQFNIPNPVAQVGLPKVECKFPLPKGYTTEFIEMCCSDVIEILRRNDCEVSFSRHELIIKFTLKVFDIGETLITDALKNMQKEYPSYELLDLTRGMFNRDDVRKKENDIDKRSNVSSSVSYNGTLVSFYGKMWQDVRVAKDKVVSLLLMTPRANSEQNSPKDTKNAGSKFVIYLKDTTVSQEFEIAEKKYDRSPMFYDSANEKGQSWNSRFSARSLNSSAGQTKGTTKYGKQFPTASDDKSSMKQKKYYLEKENEEKTAQTLETVREDYSPIEIYSRLNQAWPKCDTQSSEQNIGQRKSSNMSETSNEKLYEVKKVGKSWLLGKSGGILYVCPLLSNAKEVDISDNFIEADDKVYEIKEDKFEQVYLVSVKETPIYNQHNSNRGSIQSRQKESISPSLISQRRSRGWFQSHQQETLPQYAINLNEMKITDDSEIGKNTDQYYLLEAGQTEDSSLIEVAFPAKQ